ncbi:hypothetical protein [Rhizobium tumorigenes]|uniref:hypothetical protein n=1 Tax=Rhizobium tumorigenes TaxID=2041385 RepID=UPI00241DF387|nr:hypothetical protein [Rhizobium tumorigenes]WFS04196.1 hypothetical protein PR016_24245 [Rhizobium tumorigenes]
MVAMAAPAGWAAAAAAPEAVAGTGAAAAAATEATAAFLVSNPIGWAILGVVAVGTVGYIGYKVYQNAHAESETKSDSKTRTVACATCAENPCAALACGVPGTKYRGGAHGCMTGTPDTKGDGLDSHHMPARSKSPLPPAVGPAIQMEPTDHAQTASYKGRVNGPTYAAQRALLSREKTYAAFLLDAADAKRVAAASGDPAKYDGAIAQATAYATCLKRNGIIQ